MGGAFPYGELPRLLKESVHCGIIKGRIMFNFRPYVLGFNVQPPADPDVPGFRMNADGSVRTDGATSSRPPSYTSVGWTPNADAYGNAEIAQSNSYGPSYWSDARNGVNLFGEGMAAVGKGAYSLVPGVVNYYRGTGRALGLYGPQEAQRFDQEMNAAGEGLRLIAENPVQSFDLAKSGLSKAVERNPDLPLRIVGRVGLGSLLSLYGMPWLPLTAAAGDTLHALEKGHDFFDAIGHGIAGTLSR